MGRFCNVLLILLAAAASTVAAAAPEPGFVEAGAAGGFAAYQMTPGMGGGLAAADFDGDGDIDVFVPTAEGTPDQLYLNLGGAPLLFAEVAAERGLASLERGRSALWLDADGDGRLDLVVAGDCFQTDCVAGTTLLRLYRQTADHTFVDVTAWAGLFDDAADHRSWHHRGGLAAGDVNRDGAPDVFVPAWQGGTRLYLNRGDGTFIAAEETSGAVRAPTIGVGPWQGLVHDFDRDGRQDLFVAVDFAPDRLLVQGNGGTFVDLAPAAGLDRPWNGMGAALGDVDNDGDFDLYVTNISDDFFEDGARHSTFYLNRAESGLLRFDEVSAAAGVDDVGWGWGVTFFDADNDGLLDLAATNGYIDTVDASRFFFNQGGDPLTFREASTEVGFDDLEWGSALAAFDADRDGDLDLVQACMGGPLRLLVNQLVPPGNRYLVVRPRREGRFPIPLGARVEVEVGGATFHRLISAGTSFMSQEPAEAFFGLGTAETADRVTVHWPGGGTTTLHDVATDQTLDVTSRIFADGVESGDLGGWSDSQR